MNSQRRSQSCKTCGASIIWATNMKTGKASPFDLEIVEGGQWSISPDNKSLFTPDKDYGYTSHFATCPQANQHRKQQ